MKRFTLKETGSKEILNLKDTLEFRDDAITMEMCDFEGTRTVVTYVDENWNCYRKDFIDLYYDEIKQRKPKSYDRVGANTKS